jgi:hypothetical protein
MLDETPWVCEAQSETQAHRNVGPLFDGNRLDEETAQTLHALSDRQLSDGLWSWFPGGPSSEYISLFITTGFGRLRHLGVNVDVEPAVKSLAALDAGMDKHYRRIRESKEPDAYVPSPTDARYLYGRSFFLKDKPVAEQYREALEFFLRQSRKFWVEMNCLQSQAQLALALQRFGDAKTPRAIMKSIKERSVSDEELGMYWPDSGHDWWWYDAPIETQAVMIEAFGEVAHDAQAVEDCKVWLLKQKQTQDWGTTKATADAIYALLLSGDNLLGSDALVNVALGGKTIKPDKVEAGTGFYEQRFVRDEIKPAMGRITVTKTDSGVSWGGIHWQYHYQDGLAYYESTRDTATDFFIDYLPKGVYVFEYSTRVQLKGRYQTGIAEIQCMYAPELNSHSESLELEVK